MGQVVESIAIGVGVGALVFFTGGLGIAALSGFGAAVGIGAAAMSLSMTLMMKTPNTSAYTSQSERKQVLRSAAASKTATYGKTVSAGVLIFAEEQSGEQTDGEWVHLVIAIAGHYLHGIGTIWLGDNTIDTYGEYASHELINDAQTVNQFLVDNCPSWKSDMIGKGVALLRVSLKFNADKFPSGIPNIKLEKFGRELYDPRDGLTKYSNNAALVILDYYRNYLYVSDSELLWDYWKEAANICDETVTNSDGTTEPRYTINGEFDLSETKTKVLDDMLLACAGDPVYVGGKHGLMVGAYYGPDTLDLYDYQISGDISITPESSMTDRINTVTGKFVDPEQSYADTDFPAVTVDAWIEADGGEIKEDVTYRFVTSEWQAQRLANIKLRLKRYGRTIKVPMNMSGFAYRPGRYVNLYIKTLGIDGHTFRIRDWDFHPQNGIAITLRDEPPEVYGDAIGAALIRSALTSLPTGGVAMPDNLQFVTEQVGDVVQGLLTWTNTGTITVNNVIVRRDGTTVLTAQTPGQSCRLSGLPSGQYTAEVRAAALTGAQSPAAGVSFTIATPPIPVAVNIEAANWSLELRPVFATAASFGTLCEFFFSTVNVPLANVEATTTNLGLAAYLVHTGLQPDTEYHYWIRAVNAYGKSAFYALTARTAYDPASLIAVLDSQIGAEQLRADLRTQIELIPGNTSSLQKIQVDLSSLTTRQEQAEAILKAAQDTLGSTTINVSLLHDELSRLVQKNSADVQSLREAIFTVNAETGEITADALAAERNERLLSINQVTQRLAAAEGLISQKATTVDVELQRSRLSTVESQIDSINGQLIETVTQAEFGDAVEDVTQLTNRMSAAEGAINSKAEAQSVNEVSQRVSTAEQTLQAVNNDLQSKAQQINQISSAYQQADQQNTAAITELGQTVATQNQTTAQQLQSLGSSLGELDSSVTELQQTVTGESSSMAGKLEILQARANAAAVAAANAALADDETARGNRKSEAAIKHDQSVLANEQEAQAKTIEQISAELVTTEQELTAKITEAKTTSANAVQALSQTVETLESELKAADSQARSSVEQLEQTVATENEAMNQRVTQAVSGYQSSDAALQAALQQEGTTRALVDGAQAQQIAQMSADYKSADAALGGRITDVNNTLVAGDAALAQRMTLIESTAQSDKATLQALIQQEGTTRAGVDGVQAQQIATSQAAANEALSSVQTVSLAQAGTANQLAALWATKAQVNGASAGFGLEVQLNADGSVISSFIIDADVFAVLSRAIGVTSTIHPFVVKNGIVYINHAMIDSAEINQLIASYISVTELVGVVIRGAAIYGTNIFGGALNIGSGKALINSDGRATFQDIVVSGGSINIGNGKAVINPDGSAYFENPVISRDIVVDSGSVSVGNILSAADWQDVGDLMPLPTGYTDRSRKHRRKIIIANIPFGQWSGSETYMGSSQKTENKAR
jgi:hypothetical protein